MKRLFERPKQTYVAAVVLMVALFALGGVGQHGHSSLSWIGAVGWFSFLFTFLMTALFSIALLVRTIKGRRTA